MTFPNNRVRDECLNRNQWLSLLHAQVGIGDWKQNYNQHHRHSSLDYLTPNEYAHTCKHHRLQNSPVSLSGASHPSWSFSEQVRTAGLVQSIGTIGDAYDNAVVESFWGSMQIELLNRKKWNSRLEPASAMIDWIETFYNPTRRHSNLGNISPAEYERRHHTTAA